MTIWQSGAGIVVRRSLGGIHLIVPIGADHHQVLQVRPRQHILQQVERCRVQPLQIIEEECQRVFRPGEDTDESAEDQLKAALRLLRLKLRHRRLFAEDELQLGD